MTIEAIKPAETEEIVFTGANFSAANGWTKLVNGKGETRYLKGTADCFIMVPANDLSKMGARFFVRGIWGNPDETQITVIDKQKLGTLEEGDEVEILTNLGPLRFRIQGETLLQTSGVIAVGDPDFSNPLALIREGYLETLDRTLDILCD